MTSTEIINTLMECTPLNKDVICIINEFLQPPTFKVGSKYYGSYSYSDGMGGYVHIYTVIKKTKCFLTLKKRSDDTIIRKKIQHDKDYEGEEYVVVGYDERLYSSTLWNDWYEIKHELYGRPEIIKDKPDDKE